MTPEQISSTYSAWEIVVRRWMATWLDLLFLGVVIWGLVTLTESQKALGGGLALLVLVIYYPLTEGLAGRTFGKWLCGLRVVDEQGALPGIGKAGLRTLSRLVEINPLLFGGLPAAIAVFSSKTRQRMGDRAARTFVLKTEDLPLLSAPGTGGPPAIQEFSLPLGMPLSFPLAPGGVPSDAYGRPQRLPTQNRVWALPGALLLTAATVASIFAAIGATQAEKRERPVVLTCAQFLAAPPKAGWYRLTNCDYLLQDAQYTTNELDPDDTNAPAKKPTAGSEIGDIYIPVFGTAENAGKKTPLLVKTTDARTRKLLEQVVRLGDADQQAVTRWVEQHFAELHMHREITGTVSDHTTLPDAIRKLTDDDKTSRLQKPFIVLSEGDEPSGWGSLSAVGGALFLGILAVIAWLLTFISLAAGGGSPPPVYGIRR